MRAMVATVTFIFAASIRRTYRSSTFRDAARSLCVNPRRSRRRRMLAAKWRRIGSEEAGGTPNRYLDAAFSYRV